MARKRIIVSASDVGKAAFCAHSMSLDLQNRHSRNDSTELMDKGRAGHELLTNKVLDGQDKRCFVATHAFGENHPHTQQLRQWRDRVLKPYAPGRVLISAYYWSSPKLVQLCKKSPWLDRSVRCSLLWLVGKLA